MTGGHVDALPPAALIQAVLTVCSSLVALDVVCIMRMELIDEQSNTRLSWLLDSGSACVRWHPKSQECLSLAQLASTDL